MARTRADLLDDYKATCAALGDKFLARENLTEQLAGMDRAIAVLSGKSRVLLEEIAAAPAPAPEVARTPHMGMPMAAPEHTARNGESA